MLTPILTLTFIIILKIVFRRLFFQKIACFKDSFLKSQDFHGVVKKTLKKIISFKSFDSFLYLVCSVFLAVFLFSPVMSYSAGEGLDLKSLFQYVCPQQPQAQHFHSRNYFFLTLGGLGFMSLGFFIARSHYSESFALKLQNIFLNAVKQSNMPKPTKFLIDFKNPPEINGALEILIGKLETEHKIVDHIKKPFQDHGQLVSQIRESFFAEITPKFELKELTGQQRAQLLDVNRIESLSQLNPEAAAARIGLQFQLDFEQATQIYREVLPLCHLFEKTQQLKKVNPHLINSMNDSTQELVDSKTELTELSNSVFDFNCQEFFNEILQQFYQP